MKDKVLYWLGVLLLSLVIGFAKVAGKAAKEHEPLPHRPADPVIESTNEPAINEPTAPVIEIADPN
jgi:hypothetical protein